jgi:uroporphyrin-3 C-methyltransferase
MTDKKNASEPKETEVTPTSSEATKDTNEKESGMASDTASTESSDAKTPDTQSLSSKSKAPNGGSSQEKAAASTSAPTESAKKQKKPNNLIAWVALIIAIITAGYGYWYLQQQNQQLSQELATIKNSITSNNQQLSQSVDSASKDLTSKTTEMVSRVEVTQTQQQQSIEALQNAISDVKGRRPNDWLLAEADYLVNLASSKLNLEQDVVTATHLMESADQRVAALNDPSLTELRQRINDDLTVLRSTPIYDKDGLVLKLISLQKTLDTLPLANAVVPEAEQEAPKTVSNDISDWQDNLMSSLKAFSDQFITYRVRDGSAVPLLSPQQHFYLRENAKAKLETAIRGVYREQDELYRTSLETVIEWSAIYFAQDDTKVQGFEKQLKDLLDQDVSIEYPSNLTTQPVLEEIIRTRLRKEVTTLGSKEAS